MHSNADREFFRTDELLQSHTRGVVTNVIELMRLNVEEQPKGKLVPVSLSEEGIISRTARYLSLPPHLHLKGQERYLRERCRE